MIFSLESPRNTCRAEAALSYEVVVRGARSVGVSLEFSSQSFRGPTGTEGLEPFRGKVVLGDFEAAMLAVALLEISSEPATGPEVPLRLLKFGLAGEHGGAPPTELPVHYLSAVGAATRALRAVREASDNLVE